MKYDPQKIEKKWQKIWEKGGIYKSRGKAKKFYVLDMFPYPSGEGLHVGHPRGYIATDVVARFKMRRGFDVLHPMGWDAFGLPAENYALANKIHPKIAVSKNIKRFKEQMNKIGFTYDWSKEINTTDPEYYKWTQWIFLKMFENGLVYGSREPIIWCPSCKTGLALEDLEDGKCERCGSEVEKKPLRQWVLKMTAYAEKLLNDLKSLDWPQPIIDQQRNWIGKSEGATIKFPISDTRHATSNKDFIEVFTTRLDTIFGCTYLVVAPEHEIIQNSKFKIQNFSEVKKYVDRAKRKTDLARTDLAKDKTGVELKGVKVVNPFNNEEVPIFVADYVLGSYGTGAVMAVPAHDERDWEFATRYQLPIVEVVTPRINADKHADLRGNKANPFVEDGILIDSGKYTGLTSQKAQEEMVKWLSKNKLGGKKINYKMRDWVFARQRYWGEPFPLVFCDSCRKLIISNFSTKDGSASGGQFPISNKFSKKKKFKIKNLTFTLGEILNLGWVQVPETQLPVKLPEVKKYQPSGTGESPLANIKDWVITKCPKCNGHAHRETNTMPQWAGSNWYYLAYLMKRGGKYNWDKKEIKKWMPVDLYVGGVEHATRHLLYARFWYKFLYDIKAVFNKEPFHKLVNQGLILAEDGRKMSKRWKNVINPDDIIKNFGADTLRLYEMFMGPFVQSIAWSTDGLKGMKRFLDRVWKMRDKISDKRQTTSDKRITILINQTIKKVTEDIEGFKFNTAVSAMMILANELEKEQFINKSHYLVLISLLSPFVPHFSEERWKELGGKNSIHLETWPNYNPKFINFDEFDLVVQINGKVRDKISIRKGISQKEAQAAVLNLEKIKQIIGSAKIKKIIFVPDRLMNIVL